MNAIELKTYEDFSKHLTGKRQAILHCANKAKGGEGHWHTLDILSSWVTKDKAYITMRLVSVNRIETWELIPGEDTLIINPDEGKKDE